MQVKQIVLLSLSFLGLASRIAANGITPLMKASYKGQLPLVQQLLAQKASVNSTTLANKEFDFGKLLSNRNHGTTALMLAAYVGRPDIVLPLLKSGAQVNAQDSDGQTALIYAILGQKEWPHAPLCPNRKSVLILLLNNGANPSISDKNGLDAAYYYSCVAGLVPGFNGNFENDQDTAQKDPIFTRMK